MMLKVYHKKRHHKRGNKICEIDENLEWSEMIDEIKNHTDLIGRFIRVWSKENNTIIDYGSHHSYIVIKERADDDH